MYRLSASKTYLTFLKTFNFIYLHFLPLPFNFVIKIYFLEGNSLMVQCLKLIELNYSCNRYFQGFLTHIKILQAFSCLHILHHQNYRMLLNILYSAMFDHHIYTMQNSKTFLYNHIYNPIFFFIYSFHNNHLSLLEFWLALSSVHVLLRLKHTLFSKIHLYPNLHKFYRALFHIFRMFILLHPSQTFLAKIKIQ